ncbi:ABC transporter substrate-binding protein [Sulfurimonas paralvinellae]|uniref:ABC transporter substrate-binding protein n=1 Tax=Sulfurimonas paralvinellae TaxID=317658 RepID=A0A7M1BAS8_9BACT|nr:ABC transporter substrate-binding protein [Sulfurimonas paralvinellae]QOP46775.1 ABC transporter substrate-binding protein [Sulfurimonas paralvinellae]
MLKKLVLGVFVALSLHAGDFKKVDTLTLSGPMASVSHPLLRIIESGALNDVAKNVKFVLWKSPDELRALTLRGKANFIAVPTNVAANLYNKGVDIKLQNVSIWGILGMLTRDKNKKTLADFKGCEIVMPFRGDMPDIVFQEIAKKEGLDPKKDFKIQYVSSPIDAMQMLIMRRVDNALLVEPAISMALRKTHSFPLKLIAPDLYRSANLQKEWGEVFHVDGKIPQAGMATVGQVDPYIVKRFNQEYAKALKWYKTHPEEAGKLVNKYIPMLTPEAVADSISHVQLNDVAAKDAKKDLEFFFNVLKQNNPKIIGGKLPDAGFYQ